MNSARASSITPIKNPFSTINATPDQSRQGSRRSSVELTRPNTSDYLSRVVINHIQRVETPESTHHKAIRVASQAAYSAISIVGTLTFAKAAGLPAGDNNAYKAVLIASNTLAFSALGTSISLTLVNEAMEPKSKAERNLEKSDLGLCAKATGAAISVILGLGAVVPNAYIAYVYNDNKIVYPIIVMLAYSNFPIYSVYLSTQEIFKKRDYSPFEKKLDESKNILLALLSNRKASLLSSNREEQLKIANLLCESITSSDLDETTKLRSHLQILLDFQNTPAPKESKTATLIQKIATTGSGLFLSAALLSHYWMAGYKATGLITEHEISKQSTAAFVTACSTQLTVKLLTGASNRIWNIGKNLIQGKIETPLSVQLFPKFSITSKIVAAATTALCYGATAQFNRDNFGYLPYALEKTLEIGSCIGNALIVHGAMDGIIDGVVPNYAKRFGNEEEQKIAFLFDDLDKLGDAIRKANIQNFGLGLHNWIQLLGDEFGSLFPITKEELNAYVKVATEATLTTPLLAEV